MDEVANRRQLFPALQLRLLLDGIRCPPTTLVSSFSLSVVFLVRFGLFFTHSKFALVDLAFYALLIRRFLGFSCFFLIEFEDSR